MSDASNPADAAARMMQDMWKAFLPPSGAAPGATAAPGAPANPFMPTPDMVRGMQTAFFSAMEESAERVMRTPQFLEAMQKGMQESLAMQQQLRSYLQANIDQSMQAAGTSGSGGTEAATVAALQRIERKLDQLGERMDAVERGGQGVGISTSGGKDDPA